MRGRGLYEGGVVGLRGAEPDLFVSLGHPLVPVVEHFQPLDLPLPQHLGGDVLGPAGGGRGR